MLVEIREMKIEDYEEVKNLWHASGIVTNYADNYEDISLYLRRNPGFSFVAIKDNNIIGAVLCGHDSRHGYLCHLCVENNYRRKGIGTELVDHALSALNNADVKNCHILVKRDNDIFSKFWEKVGWVKRDEFMLMTKWSGKEYSG